LAVKVNVAVLVVSIWVAIRSPGTLPAMMVSPASTAMVVS
jgi:hypothetical protein